MRNKYNIYCFFRIILDTYGIIMLNKYHILCFSAYIRHLCNYNENKYHILCISDYGIIMRNKYHIYCFFGLFETFKEL